jgi:hypothetical protein
MCPRASLYPLCLVFVSVRDFVCIPYYEYKYLSSKKKLSLITGEGGVCSAMGGNKIDHD